MGAALRRQCCGGRDNEDVKLKADRISKNLGDNHLELFNEAKDNNDIPTLVTLVDSDQPYDPGSRMQVHPWAAPARTVGALTLSLLAMLAADPNESWGTVIRDAGGISPLIALLYSTQEDKRHAAVLALSFVAKADETNCIAMHDNGALPALIACMKDPPEGMRACSAVTCQTIYDIDVRYRQSFATAGGIPPLVALLDLPKGEYKSEELDTQAEVIDCISDLILENEAELPDFVAQVKNAGVARRLTALEKVKGNADLVERAHMLLVRLAD